MNILFLWQILIYICFSEWYWKGQTCLVVMWCHIRNNPPPFLGFDRLWPRQERRIENWLRHLVNWTENFILGRDKEGWFTTHPHFWGLIAFDQGRREDLIEAHGELDPNFFILGRDNGGWFFPYIFFKLSEISLIFFWLFFTVAMNQQKHCQFYRWNWYIVNVLTIFPKFSNFFIGWALMENFA